MISALYDTLTPMERNCLRLAHHTCKAEQIAHELGIKASTVNSHIYSARKKLGGISRLSAADQLRLFEAGTISSSSGNSSDMIASTVFEGNVASFTAPHSLSKQALRIVDRTEFAAGEPHPAEVREQRSQFVFDDVELRSSGGQDRDQDVALRRFVMILAMAALAALVLIAAPAIYDSTAQRIANSLERPHD